MNRKSFQVLVCALFLLAAAACSKRSSQPQLVVEIPAGFSGNFLLEMGIRDAAPLERQGDAYRVTVSKSGKVATSTLLSNPDVVFKNASDGSVWGLTQSMFNTGDGIEVGGKIEFFVGTRKEYDAEQNKKNHSSGLPTDDVFALVIG